MIGGVVLVMGGTSGIGAAVSQLLSRNGYSVVAVGLPASAQEQVPALTEIEVLYGDAREGTLVAKAVALSESIASRQQISLVGLVHVAGGSGRRMGDGALHEISDAGWSETLRWNLDSVFLSNRAMVQALLKQQRGGSIVNLGSVLARSPAPVHFATHAYASAKAGLLGLTTAAAAHYAPMQIRFNAVLPGLIDTPMAQRAVSDPAIQKYLSHKQPLGQGGPGTAEDVAELIGWLISPAARWVTGQAIAVDGGWSVSEGVGRESINRQ